MQLPGPSAAADDLGMTASVRERATRPGDGAGTAQRDSPQRLRAQRTRFDSADFASRRNLILLVEFRRREVAAARLPSKASVDAALRMT